MHWYVGFTDPPRRPSPTLFEHAGGLGPLTRAARLLHEKHIPADPLLAPVFADMPADQPQALAGWLAAALGGPRRGAGRGAGRRAGRGTGRGTGGLPYSLLSPAGQPVTAEQRARWAVPGQPGRR